MKTFYLSLCRWRAARPIRRLALVLLVNLFVALPALAARVNDADLIALWTIDEGTGNKVFDAKFDALPVSHTNMTILTGDGNKCLLDTISPSSVRWDPPLGALEFFGESDRDLQCVAATPTTAADEIYKAMQTSDEFTAEVWFSPANTTDVADIFSYGNSLASGSGNVSNFFIRQNGADIEFGVRNDAPPATTEPLPHPTLRAIGFVKVGTPTQVTVRWYGKTIGGFVGLTVNQTGFGATSYNQEVSLPISSTLNNWSSSYVYLAQKRTSLGINFKGRIYLAAIYDRALSPTEVGDNFAAGYLPCTDADNDGYGDPGNPSCTAGQAARDCDDTPAGDPLLCTTCTCGVTVGCSVCAKCVNPVATEVCDGIDNDCDVDVDEGGNLCLGVCTLTNPPCTNCTDATVATDADTCTEDKYVCSGINATVKSDTDNDGDNDNYSACSASCTVAGGFVCDCDDGDNKRFPGNPEICGDGKDNDCDGTVDNGTNDCGGVCPLANPPCNDCTDATVAWDADTCTEDKYVCSSLNATVKSDSDTDTDNDNYSACTASCTALQNCDCNDTPGTRGVAVHRPEVNIDSCTGVDYKDVDNDCDGVIDEDTTITGNQCGGSCILSPAFDSSCESGGPSDLDNCADDKIRCNLSTANLNDTTCFNEDTDLDNDNYSPCTATCTIAGGDTCDCQDTGVGAINVYPGAAEQCNSKDDDCNGVVDDNVAVQHYCWDNDGDLYGNKDIFEDRCAPSNPKFVLDCTDCNDTTNTISPGQATDSCAGVGYQGVDNNCINGVDEGTNACNGSCTLVPTSGTLCDFPAPADKDTCQDDSYQCDAGSLNSTSCVNGGMDTDGDQYSACVPGVCAVGDGKNCDCDDADGNIHFGIAETCNGKDDDCNGVADDNPTGGTTTYCRDLDGDGWGKTSSGTEDKCAPSPGFDADCNDCDDTVATGGNVYPGHAEVCDGKDNDCNGQTDEVFGTKTCGLAGTPCFKTVNECVNGNPQTCTPGTPSTEGTACNGVDDDCDGTPDDGIGSRLYLDFDGDGFGDPDQTKTILACPPQTGYVGNSSDCNDANPSIKPTAPDNCDGIDDDCNPATPDGWGDTNKYGKTCPAGGATGVCAKRIWRCDSATSNWVCKSLYSALPEQCDGLDNDCDDDGSGTTYTKADGTLGGIDEDCLPVLGCPVDICFQALWLCPRTCQ